MKLARRNAIDLTVIDQLRHIISAVKMKKLSQRIPKQNKVMVGGGKWWYHHTANKNNSILPHFFIINIKIYYSTQKNMVGRWQHYSQKLNNIFICQLPNVELS